MSERQLRRRLRELKYEHRMLMDELYELTDSPDGIEHFEDFYLGERASILTVRRHLRRMRQFPRAVKKHIIEDYQVKQEIRDVNKRLLSKELRRVR